MTELFKCPICNSTGSENILDLNCGTIDGSTLYTNAVIDTCNKCGHIYNRLSFEEIYGLIKYYNDEYAPTNMGAADCVGDRPGSKNSFTISRYQQLYSLIGPLVSKEDSFLDVGCAMGGFLDFLHEQGFCNLYGIELTKNYVDYANKSGKYCVKQGNAESIPFDNDTFDVLVIDQVMEHLIKPTNAFKEAKRVLKNNGLFCIGVPDAMRYNDFYFFDFYWFIMREHIQHFDVEHLTVMAENEGFELINHSKSESPMMSDTMVLPNLNIIFRLTGKRSGSAGGKSLFSLSDNIKRYIAADFARLAEKKKIIEEIRLSQKDLYLWGIGREFLYLYEQTDIKRCKLAGLLDTNPYKQQNMTVGGMKIADPSIIKSASDDSVVLITAVAHYSSIAKYLFSVGYKGRIIHM